MILKIEQNPAQGDIEVLITCPSKNSVVERIVSLIQSIDTQIECYSDGDEQLNSGIFGLPSEPVGKTNYNLKGAPGGFSKLKAPVNDTSQKLIVNMGKVRLL
jgi:hypothetical protein